MPRERVHVLKCWPEPFAALLEGTKRHEVRKDDRGFMVGDLLCLQEWEPYGRATPPRGLDKSVGWQHHLAHRSGMHTGRELWYRVSYKSAGGTWGLPPDTCVLSIGNAQEPDHA